RATPVDHPMKYLVSPVLQIAVTTIGRGKIRRNRTHGPFVALNREVGISGGPLQGSDAIEMGRQQGDVGLGHGPRLVRIRTDHSGPESLEKGEPPSRWQTR